MNLATRWHHLHWFQIGHQVASHTLPHCLGLPYWHYQLVLSLYLHQFESHQLSLQKWLTQWVWDTRTHRSDQGHLGPIKIKKLVIYRYWRTNLGILTLFYWFFLILLAPFPQLCTNWKWLFNSRRGRNVPRSVASTWSPSRVLACKYLPQIWGHKTRRLNITEEYWEFRGSYGEYCRFFPQIETPLRWPLGGGGGWIFGGDEEEVVWLESLVCSELVWWP